MRPGGGTRLLWYPRKASIGLHSVAIGTNLIASGNHSVALGRYAATGFLQGTFAFGDASTTAVVTPGAANQFVVRAAGGTTFFTNAAMNAGVSLAPGGGSWDTLSDRGMKTYVRALDGEDVLAKLAQIISALVGCAGPIPRASGHPVADQFPCPSRP